MVRCRWFLRDRTSCNSVLVKLRSVSDFNQPSRLARYPQPLALALRLEILGTSSYKNWRAQVRKPYPKPETLTKLLDLTLMNPTFNFASAFEWSTFWSNDTTVAFLNAEASDLGLAS